MTYRKVNWVGGLAALTLVITLPATTWAAGIVLQGDLLSPALSNGYGTVEYQANHQGTNAKLRISLDYVMSARSADVVIGGQLVGTIDLTGYGEGELHLATRRGDIVPTLQAGDVVDIYEAGTIRLLLKGSVHQVP